MKKVTCACGNAVEPPRRSHCSTRCSNLAATRRYSATEKFRVAQARYRATDRWICTQRKYNAMPSSRKRVRDYARSAKGKAVRKAGRSRRRIAVMGRKCIGCGRMDGETHWSRKLSCCQACARAGSRNGWCSCGSPLFRGYHRGPPACRAKCGAA